MSRVLWFHARWVYVAVVTSGLVGLWGVTAALAKRDPHRSFAVAAWVAVAAMLVQIAAGTIAFLSGIVPGNDLHVFYGVVIAVTFALAYVYRSTMDRRPALWYGLLFLFVMGLGIRAWTGVD